MRPPPLTQQLKKFVPIPVRRALRYSQWAVLDLVDMARGVTVPPRRKRAFVATGDFEAAGKEHLAYFIKYGKLRPEEHVLDVGCGIGRMTLPLTGYLSVHGTYDGFDPNREGIAWCTKHITSRFPNFRFRVADLHNEFYNPTGKFSPETFRFPYPDDSFDFVVLASVFTHLFPLAMKNYFREINRVMKPSGRSFITYFLLNAESSSLIQAGKSTQDFVFALDGCRTTDKTNPEAAIAFEEVEVRAMYGAAPLEIADIKYGHWCGRQTPYEGYQDVIIATKK